MLAMTACGDDPQQRLIGTWKQNPGDAKSFFGVDPVTHYFTFNSDGTYKEQTKADRNHGRHRKFDTGHCGQSGTDC